MTLRIGLLGLDSSHAEDFIRHLNREKRHDGLRVTAMHGGDPARLREISAIDPAVVAAESIDGLIAGVDAVIVGDRDGARHLAHALPCIEAGLPVFIDKPLANIPDDAAAIVAAAARVGVPLLSGSALRWQPETRRLKAELALDGDAIDLLAYGTWFPDSQYGGPIFYAIHAIELAQELLGPAFCDVQLRGGDRPVVSYRCGRHRVSLAFRPPGDSDQPAFGVEFRNHQRPIPLGDDYMLPVVDEIAVMLKTRRSALTMEEMLAPVALMAEIEALLSR